MTIKKRLFLSNIIMIVIPALSTVLAGLLCLGGLWLFVLGGAGVGVQDTEDFDRVCQALAEVGVGSLNSGLDLTFLDDMIDGNGIAVRIFRDGTLIYDHGQEIAGDKELTAAADALPGDALITMDGRSIFHCVKEVDGKEFTMYCFGGGNTHHGGYRTIKVILVISMIIIILVIVLSIFFTNRFLIRFVFKRIEEPLDMLTAGVNELAEGNLDYRIIYDRKDEFSPICEDFNEMADRLKLSINTIKNHERSRKELLAGISHDIRSPLTSIQAYVEGLLDGIATTPQMQRQYLEVVRDKALDLEHMVSQLFLFSKMDLGEFPEIPELIHVDEVIKDALTSGREIYRAQGLEISTDLSPACIIADPIWIQRIIGNILDNSVKYKTKDMGHADIRLGSSDSLVSLTISDDGPGVPEETLPYLFEVFYRTDSARKNPGQGSGLGLAIVARVVEHMGGSISAAASETGGLEIKMCFPKADTNDDINTHEDIEGSDKDE